MNPWAKESSDYKKGNTWDDGSAAWTTSVIA